MTRVLGAGGFGVGVKARHRATGEDVALKFLVRSPDGGGDGKRRRHRAHALHRDLLREACYLAACRGHPSVVGLHGIARDPRTGQCSLVLEHVGPSLGHVLRGRRGPFTEEETRRVLRQLLSGAGRMRERGIVHGDIQPGNIVVGGEGVVKICDLGLAVSMASRGRAAGPARAGTWLPRCSWGSRTTTSSWTPGRSAASWRSCSPASHCSLATARTHARTAPCKHA